MLEYIFLRESTNSICTLETARREGGGGQAYSLLPTTHGHMTDCKLDSVVYAGVSVVL